ncbi:MAG: single-stranded DNA-binding protein [Candidatus Dormiibacterota bacterium]
MATRKPRTVSDAPAPTPAEPVPTSTRRSSAPSVNAVTLVGRLVADPILRQTTNGTAVANLRLAVNDGPTPQFCDVVAWKGTAEAAAQYLSKGRLILVTGRMATRAWQAPDGTTRRTVEVVARRIQFLPGGSAPAAV